MSLFPYPWSFGFNYHLAIARIQLIIKLEAGVIHLVG